MFMSFLGSTSNTLHRDVRRKEKDIECAPCAGFKIKQSTEIAKYFLFPKEVLEENMISVDMVKDTKYDPYVVSDTERMEI